MIATGQGKTLTKLALLAGAMLLAVACGKSGGAGGAGGGGSGSVCGTEFSTDYCEQAGTNGQETRCGSVTNSGTTCNLPEIRYGSTEGGIPAVADAFVATGLNGYEPDLDAWCKQLGFMSFGSVEFEFLSCGPPQGRVFWCSTGTVSPGVPHWCDGDLANSDWKDGTLTNHICNPISKDRISLITCTPMP